MSSHQAKPAKVQGAEKLLTPPYRLRLIQQFFTHSAHAPVTILILEWLLSGPGYFSEPDAYFLILAALGQAAWLAHSRADHAAGIFFGNLLGVALYTLVEGLFEGVGFWDAPQHIAYWIVAVAFAVLQATRHCFQASSIGRILLLLENICRAGIPVLLYAVFEARSKHEALNLSGFFADPAHDYLTIIVLLLGVLLGFADLTQKKFQRALHSLTVGSHRSSTDGLQLNG